MNEYIVGDLTIAFVDRGQEQEQSRRNNVMLYLPCLDSSLLFQFRGRVCFDFDASLEHPLTLFYTLPQIFCVLLDSPLSKDT